MENPKFVKINDKKYKINTDFRIALECNEISLDENIGEYEKVLAIIYKLYGKEGLDCPQDYEKLIELGQKYLLLGKEEDENSESNVVDMDFIEDMDYIKASFMSDYNIDLEDKEMHWWTFCNLLNGLSNSELGNCCVLNKIRNLRNYDTSQIKDSKTRTEIEKAKKMVELKRNKKQPTTKQQESMNKAYELLGL